MTGTGIEITPQSQDAARRTYVVSVSPEKVAAAEAATTARYAKQLRVPGFRKGHVPPGVVRRRYSDAIRQSVIEELLRESWQATQQQEALKPVADPQVRNVKFEEGAPLTFELLVDVKPEIKLGRLGGFRLTRRTQPVTDEMVGGQLLQLREQRAPWLPAEGKAKPGDLVEATITNLDEPAVAPDPRRPGTAAAVAPDASQTETAAAVAPPARPGPSTSATAPPAQSSPATSATASEPVRFVLGQGRALAELENRLMELDPGQSWEGSLTFPDDHPDAAKRGQSRRVRVALGEVKQMALPELTDDFAREVGDFESVDALRAAVRKDLEDAARREADARVRGELIDQIAAANNVAVPPSLLERALAAYVAAYGVPEDQRGRFAAEFRPVAEAAVRRDLIIEAVAEQASLAASAEALDARVAEVARRRGESPAAVKAALEKAGRLRELQRSITEENVFAHLLGQSTVEDAPMAR